MQPLMLGKWKVISSHTFPNIWLLIHAGKRGHGCVYMRLWTHFPEFVNTMVTINIYLNCNKYAFPICMESVAL